MIIVLFKLVIYRIYKVLGFPRIMPINYTISVTNKCNSRCRTCSIYNLKTDPLSIDEYRNIFKNIGKSPYWVTISGGEPFLRKDLPEIIIALDKHCRPRIINIPTNGILTQRIVSMVRQIANAIPRTKIIINLSIDGIGEEHDRIRNVKGNYKKVMSTFKALRKLEYPNLSVGIHTVISRYNVENFPAIAGELLELAPDSYITEIAEERAELSTIGKDITPRPLAYRAAIDYLLHRLRNRKFTGMSRITQSFRIEYYNMVKNLLREEEQIIPCYAGIASCHIAPGGEVWFCCVKARVIGELRKNNYNFRQIWFSKAAKKERKAIRKKTCFCPLANASYTNLMLHLPSLWRIFRRSFIKW